MDRRTVGDVAVCAALPALAALAVALTLADAPLGVRLPLGLAAALVLPGYAAAAAAFPRTHDLSAVERLSLSVGASVAIIAFVALALDRFRWGIGPFSLAVSLGVSTLLLSALGCWRMRQVPPAERFVVVRRTSWNGVSADTRRALLTVAGVILLCGGAIVITLAAAPGATTEFYLLGPDGLAEQYPRGVAVGDPVTVRAVITNLERHTTTYDVAIQDGADELSRTGPLTVPSGETLRLTLTF